MSTKYPGWIKIFLHVFLGLMLGLAVALVYLSSSETFRLAVQDNIEKQFQRDYDYTLSCRLEKIDWWSLKMHFSGVRIAPSTAPTVSVEKKNDEEKWSIVSEKMTATACWWTLLSRRILKISLGFEHVIMFEAFEKEIVGLPQFIAKMFVMGDSSFLVYDGVSIKDGLLFLKRKSDDLNIEIPYQSNIHQERDGTRIQTYVQGGAVTRKEAEIVNNISGSITIDMPNVDMLQNMNSQVQLNYCVHSSTHKGNGFLVGKMEKGVGQFVLKSEDGAIVIDPIKIKCLKEECLCSIALSTSSELLKYLDLPDILSDIGGKIGVEIGVDLYNFFKTFQLSVLLHDVTYKTKPLFPGGKILVDHHHAKGFSGTFRLTDSIIFDIDVSAQNDDKEIRMSNTVRLMISQDSHFVVEKDKCHVTLSYDKQGDISGRYDIELYDTKLDESKFASGSIVFCDGKLFLKGSLQDFEYEGTAQIFPDFIFEKFHAVKNNKVVIDFSTDLQNSENLLGSIDFSVLHDLVSDPFKISFAQDGAILFQGHVKDGICHARLHTQQAHMRIPNMYNVIESATASCELNFYEKSIVFKDVDMQWYEGKISCTRATMFFDKTGACYFVHVPLLLHNLMFSWDRGVYSQLSGRLLLSKQSAEKLFHVEGKLMLEKSELKENLFSSEFQELLSGVGYGQQHDQFGFDCGYDVSVFTKDPLTISTSFLSAKAIVDLGVHGSLKKPELSGAIQLVSGFLNFPYKPLDIIEGKLLFIAEQPFDPVIELVAKGKLKRFGVSVHAWGSALDPHIQFESQPYLSEEQIVSLLLLGIEDNSLGAMVPALLIQKLKDIMFGPALSKTKLKAVFDRLLKSLRYFRFLPQFTNQSGRGGIRGTFEIDATDNLHAKIDTNFAQIEDIKVDIDYGVTDDVTLRLQRDGPSTYGGEVEFCWKFS
ncbi:MAG: translocation/assembly module TamB domain-containing protein [Candidatus Dependentiae bacterium]|nr:translocation/assembly module TamB domain-containing protein [Candidatus Dependentiae bacterium]